MKEQLAVAQEEFASYRRDAERLEGVYKAQDIEKNRIIADLKAEIKGLQEEKLKSVLQKKEERVSNMRL